MKTWLLGWICFCSGSFLLQAQNPEAVEIIGRLRERMAGLKDYTADVRISINIPFLRIPDKSAKIYYKAPGRFHVETRGLALIPKTTSDLGGQSLLDAPHSALYVRRERRGPLNFHVIKIVPLNDTSQVVLATFYIGVEDEKVYRVETITREQGSVNVDFTPGNNPFGLPERMFITFEIPRVEMPAGFTGDIDVGLESQKNHIGARDKKTRGTVAVSYLQYRFNTGLRDEIFNKKRGA
ncbi:MAG: hypothetical protein N2050_02530 [Flavobacteriales bacterium]|nr:hypothetical protein [Flavobacteriales bacterium]